MATYSLAITGASADNPAQPLLLDVPDTQGRVGNEQAAMSQNTPMQVREFDGQLAWYVFDAERSVPGARRVLRRL